MVDIDKDPVFKNVDSISCGINKDKNKLNCGMESTFEESHPKSLDLENKSNLNILANCESNFSPSGFEIDFKEDTFCVFDNDEIVCLGKGNALKEPFNSLKEKAEYFKKNNRRKK